MKFSTMNIPELRLAMATKAKADVRSYLNGICFDLTGANDGDTLIDVPLVGTDGGILSKSLVRLDGCQDLPAGECLILDVAGTIPKTAELAVFDTLAGTVTLSKKGKVTNVLLLTVVDGTYPNYQRLLDSTRLGEAAVDAIAFSVPYLYRVTQAVGNKDGQVKLEFSEGGNGMMGVTVYGMRESVIKLMPVKM